VFIGKKKIISKQKSKGFRYYKSVGLGFKTPKVGLPAGQGPALASAPFSVLSLPPPPSSHSLTLGLLLFSQTMHRPQSRARTWIRSARSPATCRSAAAS
jgi:hypothetical protein